MDAPRISPEQADQDVTLNEALMVCAYDSDEKFRSNYIEGAIALDELRAIEDRLDHDQELIFYCA
jgi:hypothetical protein